jgi:ABC-2 type transport system ATP-binding protein
MKTTEAKDAVIVIKDLVQKIGPRIMLDAINLELYRGECLGVFGYRGCGKTTLLHIAAGVDRFNAGTVEVLGQQVGKSQAYKGRVGLVTQQASLFSDLNVVENLDFFCTLKRVPQERMRESIHRLELEDYLKEPLPHLDVGVYQRVALGCALLNHPEILIVDEIIRDIDLPSRIIILNVLEEYLAEGNSCLAAFSNIEYVNYTDRVAWLEDGKVSVYSPAEAQKVWREQQVMIPKKRGEKHA